MPRDFRYVVRLTTGMGTRGHVQATNIDAAARVVEREIAADTPDGVELHAIEMIKSGTTTVPESERVHPSEVGE